MPRFQVIAQKGKSKPISINLSFLRDVDTLQEVLESNKYRTQFREMKRRVEMEEINELIKKAKEKGISDEQIFELWNRCTE